MFAEGYTVKSSMALTLGPAIFFSILTGVAFALALYWKESTFDQEDVLARRIRLVSAFLRALSTGIIVFLLLSPWLEEEEIQENQITVQLLVDGSASVDFVDDSSTISNLINHLKEQFADSVILETRYFSNEVSEERSNLRTPYETNIIQSLEDVERTFSSSDVIILASDGMHNAAVNPYSLLSKNPIYTLGLGDISGVEDFKIVDVRHPRVVNAGDEVEVQVDCQANLLNGAAISLGISHNEGGLPLAKADFALSQDVVDTIIKLTIRPTQKGIQAFTVAANCTMDELTQANNVASFFIEVKDSRQNVLLCAAGPHPDIRAIHKALSEYQTMNVSLHFMKDGPPKLTGLDGIIWHNLPDERYGNLSISRDSRIPQLFIVGAATSPEQYNALVDGIVLPTGISWSANRKVVFQSSSIPLIFTSEILQRLVEMPSIRYPSGVVHQLNVSAQNMLTEGLQEPVLSNLSKGGKKIFTLIGEGWWKWQMAERQAYGNADAFNTFFQQVTNELIQDFSQERLLLSWTPIRPKGKEKVIFSLDALEENYTRVIPRNIEINLTDSKSEWDTTFVAKSNNDGIVSSDPIALRPGMYLVQASALVANKNLMTNAGIVIEDDLREYHVTSRDTALLQYIAQSNHGAYYSKEQVDNLVAEVMSWIGTKKKNQVIRSVKPRVNEIFWLCLALVFFGAEWVLRKYAGSF
ncbi:MAG TPA: hypothetical protein DCF84_02370 [Bacteroidetes bacterium]|nr:hypothetical protein [Bacteroidota bacterium]